jgi:hypothetical protein
LFAHEILPGADLNRAPIMRRKVGAAKSDCGE